MKRWRVLLAALVLAGAAHADAPEPSPETFAALVKTCTADGAFGFHFGQKNAMLLGRAGIGPFVVEDWSEGRDGLYEITAAASFAHAPMSQEDRVFLANWVFKKLDSDFAAGHKNMRRQPRADGVSFSAASFVLDLSHDGTTVRLACTDIARKKQAREDARHGD